MAVPRDQPAPPRRAATARTAQGRPPHGRTTTAERSSRAAAGPSAMPEVAHVTTAGVRAALIFSGHLRATCSKNNALQKGMALQVARCRRVFRGRCDVFLHTWSMLEKPLVDSSLGRRNIGG
eukprot:5655128-Prymnesium_polylepis.1